MIQTVAQALLVLVAVAAANILATEGLAGLSKAVLLFLRKLPGVNGLISQILKSEVKGAITTLTGGAAASGDSAEVAVRFPKHGLAHEKILKILQDLHGKESHVEEGKAFAYAYTSDADMLAHSEVLSAAYAKFAEKSGIGDDGDDSHDKFLHMVYRQFMHTNALNPMMFPSLRNFENEILSMSADMLHGDGNVVGALTSGGTESILMAVKAYRDRARALRPNAFTHTRPNMILPITIHPAFEKAAHYFDVEAIHAPLSSDFRVDVAAVRKLINSNTILIVGSAPQYCHGVVDPIEDLAKLALEKGLPLHVDACFGGFMLPWLEKLGERVPKFDFRVNGVTSISADIHKYGYSSKGASVILYRNADYRKYMYFAYAAWPGGLFGSPSMSGTRPGGMIAQAWASMVALGEEGYVQIAESVLNTTKAIIDGVNKIDGLKVLVQPDMTCLAIGSDHPDIDILAVADVMEESGWKMERQQLPNSLHCSIMPHHARVYPKLLDDLAAATQKVRNNKQLAKEGSAAMYGMVASIPDKTLVEDFTIQFFGEVYRATGGQPSIAQSYA